MSEQGSEDKGFLPTWLRSDLAALFVFLALAGGAIALLATPREEEPQIDVPLIDVFVAAPGLSAEEVERRIVWPMEQTLFAAQGVEYVYSSSFQDGAILTARFYVGESPVEGEVRVRNRLERNRHRFSPELADYQIRPVYVDDVPFMTVSLHSATVDDAGLLSMAEEYLFDLTRIEGVGLIYIVGGRNEAANIELDPQRMAAHGVTFQELHQAIDGSNIRISSGVLTAGDRQTEVETGAPITSVAELADIVVARGLSGPVRLADVAAIREGPVEASEQVWFGRGPGAEPPENATEASGDRGAVTFALAKRGDANAVAVAAAVRERLEELRPFFAAEDVGVAVTRDYGASADNAVDWLVFSLAGSSLVVIVLLAVTLGWREALIVAVSVPTTFAVALLVNYLSGFSLNRITLFALIVALGLIVDDSIVSIENIHRYLHTSAGRGLNHVSRIVGAVREVLPPMLLTSLVVVVAFIPLAFVTGLMGPYMAPMALTVPVAMLSSTLVAALIVPWIAKLVLRGPEKGGEAAQANDGKAQSTGRDEAADTDEADDELEASARYRSYAAVVAPLLDRRKLAFAFIGGLILLLIVSLGLPLLQLIPLKLLPYDDAEKLQFVVDREEGATVEGTAALNRELSALALRQNEVIDATAYAGTSGPIDFNGLVRGYYLREGPQVGDVRINLIKDAYREHSSHQIALRLWEATRPVAERYDATVKVVERPPGPPVLAPVVAEVSGPPDLPYTDLIEAARQVEALFHDQPGLLGVDSTIEAPAGKLIFEVDRQKAALAGITPQAIGQLVAAAMRGTDLTLLREAREMRPRPVRLRLPRQARASPTEIASLPLARADGRVLTVGELGRFKETVIDPTIERKNLNRVIYVTAEVGGRTPIDAVFDLTGAVDRLKEEGTLAETIDVRFDGEGEWFITRRVFRDLGIALGVATLAIYAMLVFQTGSYLIALILLSSIPLTMIGIMPGFWLLNALLGTQTAGYGVGIPFTATGMIGIVALAGIAVRNAILLIDFTQQEEKRGCSVREALLRAGALRTRPILLTAGTAMLAVVPIAFDPVFAGLAWTLIFGLFISTLFTLLLVPTLYNRVYGEKDAQAP